MTNELPRVLIGFGGHGRVVFAALRAAGHRIAAIVDRKFGTTGLPPPHIPVIRDEDLLSTFKPEQVLLVQGIGSVNRITGNSLKRRVTEQLEVQGYKFVGLTHPHSFSDPASTIDLSAQIHAGAVLQPGVRIGRHSIVNTNASIDHDCDVSEYCHIAPGATVSGGVRVGAGSHLGTGCNVIQGVQIGSECLIAAGATVVRDVPDGSSVRGCPAKQF